MAPLGTASLVGFAFVAGALTFFAPCAYPLLPGYVSYYLGRDAASGGERAANGGRAAGKHWFADRAAAGFRVVAPEPTASRLGRAVVVGGAASAGFFAVYGLLAGVVVVLGARVLAGISVLELVVGVLLVAAGTAMALGWTPPTPRVRLPERRRSVADVLGFGVLYAAAAAGCTGPIFVGVALEALSAGPLPGLAVLGAYAAGMSTLMIGVTVATAAGRDALLDRLGGRLGRVHRLAGVLLAAAGLVEIYFFLFRFGGLAMLAP